MLFPTIPPNPPMPPGPGLRIVGHEPGGEYFRECERTGRPYVWVVKRSKYSTACWDLIAQPYKMTTAAVARICRRAQEMYRAGSSRCYEPRAMVSTVHGYVERLSHDDAQELAELVHSLASDPEYQTREVGLGVNLDKRWLRDDPLIDVEEMVAEHARWLADRPQFAR